MGYAPDLRASILLQTILNRTYGTDGHLIVLLFLLAIFGPINYAPPVFGENGRETCENDLPRLVTPIILNPAWYIIVTPTLKPRGTRYVLTSPR